MPLFCTIAQGPRAGRGFNKLNQEVQHHPLTTPNVQTNHSIQLRENHFFDFGGPQKLLTPKDLIWPSKPHFWGGHTSKTF